MRTIVQNICILVSKKIFEIGKKRFPSCKSSRYENLVLGRLHPTWTRCDSDSVRHSLLSTFNVSKKDPHMSRPVHDLDSIQTTSDIGVGHMTCWEVSEIEETASIEYCRSCFYVAILGKLLAMMLQKF